MTAEQVVEEVFRTVRPDDLIPICAKRPGRKRSMAGTPYIHSFFPVRAADRYEAAQVIETATALGHPTYWMLVTLRPQACPVLQPSWEGEPQTFSYRKPFVSQIHGLFFDLDVGRAPEHSKSEFDQITADEALAVVLDLVQSNVIPLPTLTAPSGRGRYLLYLFKEPVDATAKNVMCWREVVNAFLRRLTRLAPDCGACRSLNGLFKAPGSGGAVPYSMFDDGSQTLRRYELDELDAFLVNHPAGTSDQEEPVVQRYAYEPLVRPSKRRQGHRSWLQTARPMIVRLHELERLNLRRTSPWPERSHKLLLYYATAARFMTYARFNHSREG